jgi:hypothetical protein
VHRACDDGHDAVIRRGKRDSESVVVIEGRK